MDRPVHPLIVRVTHWINVLAVTVMVLSGWKIYNASPIFDFVFPKSITLGGWLGGALALHFAMMWLLVANGLVYVAYGVFSGHFWRDMIIFAEGSVYRKVPLSLRTLAIHEVGEYNFVQRIFYLGVIADLLVLVATGLAIWKPVQFDPLTQLFGGYDAARVWHFYAMAALVAFVMVHVAAGVAVRGTIRAMITGRAFHPANTN